MNPSPFRNLTLNVPETGKPRIVVLGGGFGGIRLARAIDTRHYQVVMLDRNNYHGFQPLLYQVATAGLEPDSIAGPLRRLFAGKRDFHFRMARVTGIHPEEKKVETVIGALPYDFLVVATGSRTNFYGNANFITRSFPLKQVPHALDLRSHLLQNFERAVMTTDRAEGEAILNIVVVGGGPTGVEVAGALGELKRHVLPSDYPDFDFSPLQIHLVEGNPRLLPAMSEKAGKMARKYLEAFDVRLLLSTLVRDYDGQTVVLDSGETIPSLTLIWAAGVSGNLPEGLPTEALRQGRIAVNDRLEVPGLPGLYAIGDIALLSDERYPQGLPMLAPVALQQGEYLARSFNRMALGKDLAPFRYVHRGAMATIGRNKAVVDLPGNITFGGFPAWLFWMFVHLLSIIGFRSKLIVFSNWVWNYLTYDRGTRLIVRLFFPDGKPREKYGTY
jgi:NADH:ubiquinone reductase (H+-translocating)